MIWMLACALPVETPPASPPDSCVEDLEFFAQAAPLLTDCAGCHHSGGIAEGTRLQLESPEAPELREQNWTAFQAAVAAIGPDLLLQKPSGAQSHGGGQRLAPYSADYALLAELVARAGAPGGCTFPGEKPPICGDGLPRPGSAPLRRLTPEQWANSVEQLLGHRPDPALFPSTTSGSFRSFASANPVSAAGVEQIMLAAEAAAASLELPGDIGCTAEDRACARAWALDFAQAAFRRPLSDAETQLATRFFDAGLDIDTALRMQVELILQTPQFLYLDAAPLGELDPARVETPAVAARLAYFMTDAPPDAELRRAVEAGELESRAQLAAQAARLARSPEALRSVAAFHQDWLHLWRLSGATRDSTVYPQFSDSLVDAMRRETDLFVTEQVWNGPATWDSLIFGTQSWVNPELAPIYGLSVDTWTPVELGPERPGLLTRSAFLSAHAYAADSAPVRRGAWLLRALQCTDLSPPANVNMILPESSQERPTIRERLAAHSADPACASCHTQMDPMGLSFEHFGALGEWREQWDDGHPVDASADLADPAGSVYGAAEMVALLDSDDRLKSCYTRRVFEYAVGRSAELEDACTLQVLAQRFEESGGDLHQLWVDVTLTDAFLYRHGLELAP
jgi:Protein of unknown function (DUF1592)/Protein of unknown function (DUF1588)/Protein of unknown function (DUF1585)/Protein of unknown function (DUF1595)/Protein of unknown function (DUF1587)